MRPPTDGILESSLYVADVARSAQFFRDPDRHLIEIATPGLLSIY
jgi:hypothetical protein